MLMNEAFPSKYLKADDLQGRTVPVIIREVLYETVGNDRKVAMYFQGKERGIILNKTNANTISAVYGPDTNQWAGGELELYPAMTDFQGKTVPCIRVKVPPRRPANNATIAPNARDRAMQDHQAPPPATAAPAGYDNGFDDPNDSIPF